MGEILSVGAQAPGFCLPNTQGMERKLSDYAGQYLLVFFYPKDLTPGCTIEARLFQEHLAELQALKVQVVGVSKDSPKRHQRFTDVCGLDYELLSDESGTMLEDYGVWQQKKTFGKTYMGIVRMSYLIDAQGRVAKVYPKVSPKSHAAEVLRDVQELQQS